MPKGWYDQSANKFKEEDSIEEHERKQKYQKLCANKKPYFFIYNYITEMQSYKKYQEKYELQSYQYWCMSLQDLINLENKNEEQQAFVDSYFKYIPVDMSMSTMNKICFKIEKYMEDFKLKKREPFDFSILKSGRQYNIKLKQQIENLYKKYKHSIKTLVLECNDNCVIEEAPEYNDYKDAIFDWFNEQSHLICPDDTELCDILVDICYSGRNQKELVWALCGETIVNNLLKHSCGQLTFPEQVSYNGDFEYMGKQFVMKTIMVGDETDD